MTKDEALKMALKFVEDTECGTADLEAAIKEALAQPEQEPVAWMVYTQEGKYAFVTDDPAVIHPSQSALPLYTTPSQRTWVGLTDEEIQQCLNGLPTQTIDVYARRIEAKLKEKNT